MRPFQLNPGFAQNLLKITQYLIVLPYLSGL
jgi:hypothetical protein